MAHEELKLPLDNGEWLRNVGVPIFGIDPRRYLSAQRCEEIGLLARPTLALDQKPAADQPQSTITPKDVSGVGADDNIPF